ncbi:MAG: NUDIX hydrolase [Acidobacteriota bacterium]
MLKKIIGSIWRKTPRYLRVKLVRITQKTFTVSAAAIITNKNGEILLLDHVFRTASGWGIPGGFINYDEQPEATLKREIYEETGLELHDIRLVRVRTIYSHIEILFRAKSGGIPKISREIKQAGWFGIDEMPEKMSLAEKKVITKFIK